MWYWCGWLAHSSSRCHFTGFHCYILIHQRAGAFQGPELQDVTWDLLDTHVRSTASPPDLLLCRSVCVSIFFSCIRLFYLPRFFLWLHTVTCYTSAQPVAVLSNITHDINVRDRETDHHTIFLLLPITPARLTIHLCSHPDANQYGRYGKTRAEEDAKRYLKEKEELERERDGIRNALETLRKEKRQLKEELKTAPGKNIQSTTDIRCYINIPEVY